MTTRPRTERTADRLDLVLATTTLVLAAATAALLGVRGLHAHVVAPAFDLALDTVALVVSALVATLAWLRFRERRDPSGPFLAAAFFVLGLAYLRAVVVTLGRDGFAAGSLALPEQAQVHVFLVAHVLAAVLVAGGAAAGLLDRPPRFPRLVVAVPAALVALLIATAELWIGRVPALIAADPDEVPTDALPMVTPVGAVAQVGVAVLLLVAAAGCRRVWRRTGRVGDAYIAVGLVFAAFAELAWAIYPSGHPGQVSFGDVLRLAFFIVLLLGIEAEARDLLSALRRANSTLERLREAEVERASLEERARLARELHDGLAQNLWLAKLKLGRLAAVPELPGEAHELAEEVGGALDMGLAEARQAVMALRIAAGHDGSLADHVRRYCEDVEDRYGVRIDVVCDPDLPALAPRVEAELLRIAQESLTNVHRHAAATSVGVALRRRADALELSVVDDGRGFDPGEVGRRSFGLAAMRERAALIGAELVVDSRPGHGTRVVLRVPTTARVAPGIGVGA